MRITNRESAIAAAAFLCGIAVFLSAVASPPAAQTSTLSASDVVLTLDPGQSKVHYSVESTLHTVHGTFDLKSGTVRFDPESGKAGGEIVVSATTGQSGNDSRDARMHKEILQTQKFPDAVFRAEQVEGKVARMGSSEVKLHGVLMLHGAEHEIVVLVHAQLAGDHWTGNASFEVPYIQWGMKDPSNWLLKVKPVVNIDLEMAGSTKAPN